MLDRDGSPHNARFTGHETFHLRYGWLKKSYDAVTQANAGADGIAPDIFKHSSAISHFGVGKNMVAAIKHWSLSCGIIQSSKEQPSEYEPTDLGRYIFDEKFGVDPYLENLNTMWLLHWNLVTRSDKTTFKYAFNHFNDAEIERERFLKTLKNLVEISEWTSVADATLQKDISNFIGTYAVRKIDKRVSVEDVISSPLTELGLLSQAGTNTFRFNRGRRVGLKDQLFAYCLLDFWDSFSPDTTTLSFEVVSHSPYSPGRTFLLSPDDLMTHVTKLEAATNGDVRWVESSGSRHIARSSLKVSRSLNWLNAVYGTELKKSEAA